MTFPSGISYPFRFSAAGGISKSTEANKVLDNMVALVKTSLRDRLVRKDVGTVGYQQVLKASIETGVKVVHGLIREAITKFEPRAIILDIKIYAKDTENGTSMVLEIPFIFRATGEELILETEL